MSDAVLIERSPVAGPDAPFGAGLLLREGPAHPLLPRLPVDGEAWRRAAHAARGRAGRLSAASVSRLVARLEAWGAGPLTLRNARRLGDAETLAVVTGQQPGLLGGPLMTLHKAAGALNLARRLEAQGEGPVVPVFWLASEDHDWDEANRLWLLDRESRLRRLRIEDIEAEGVSLAHLDVPDEASDRFLEEVRALVPDTERAGEILGHVARRVSEPFADWCGRCLLELFGDAGLVVLDPFTILPDAGPVLRTLLERREAVREALDDTAGTLRALGLAAPLALEPGEAPLFLRTEARGRRRRVRVDEQGSVRLRGRTEALPLGEVLGILESRPWHASGDAAGRVFVQNALLPVLAYVGGPTELAYHAQVRAAHERVGLPYPLAVPRPVATWVGPKASRLAEAFDVAIATLLRDPKALDDRDVGLDDGLLRDALSAWVRHVQRGPDALEPYLATEGQGARALRGAIERLVQQAERQVPRIEAAFARDRGVGADRRKRLEDLLHPRGRPQERTLSPLVFALRYGLGALRAGIDGLDPLYAGHQIVRVGAGGDAP